MMEGRKVESFLQELIEYCQCSDSVLALALIGTHARHQARLDSDIDILLLVSNRDAWFSDTGRTSHFGNARKCTVEEWGVLSSLRIQYEDIGEVEFGFAGPEWATVPADRGTREVVEGGIRILLDPGGLLDGLIRSMR